MLKNINIEDRVRMGKNRSQIHKQTKYQMALQRRETVVKLKDDIGITFGFQKYLDHQVQIQGQDHTNL